MASALTPERVADVLDLDFDDLPLIRKILPSVKNWIVDYCRNPFLAKAEALDSPNLFVLNSPYIYRYPLIYSYSESLSVSADDLKINDSDSKFVENEFTAETDILIKGSRFNDGVYYITKVAAGHLKIDDIYKHHLTDEDYSDEAFAVYQVIFPTALLLPVAKLVQFDMQKRKPDLKSFRLADYSENYAGDGDYPPGLKQRFTPWRNMFI